MGDGSDEPQTVTAFRMVHVRAHGRPAASPRVGHLDAEHPFEQGHPQLEVPPGDPAVGDGVPGEFGDEQRGVVGQFGAVGMPQSCSVSRANRRPRRAPRGVELKR